MSPQLGALIGFSVGCFLGFGAALIWISWPEIEDWIRRVLRKN